jgi:hypothetical protein
VEVQIFEDGDELAEAVHHFLAAAQFFGVVEVGHVNDAAQVVFGGERGDDLVDLFADLFVALAVDHVGEGAAGGHGEEAVGVGGGLVGDEFDEEQGEDVILVLGGVHAAAQFVAGFPEGAIERGLFEGHDGLSRRWRKPQAE